MSIRTSLPKRGNDLGSPANCVECLAPRTDNTKGQLVVESDEHGRVTALKLICDACFWRPKEKGTHAEAMSPSVSSTCPTIAITTASTLQETAAATKKQSRPP